MPEISQEVYQKHAERLWSMEAHVVGLPDSQAKTSLAHDLAAWHSELKADADEAGFEPLSGGTDKGNNPPPTKPTDAEADAGAIYVAGDGAAGADDNSESGTSTSDTVKPESDVGE